jgi:electron transport complex protein RnfC
MNCIRCGKCAEVCPVKLLPQQLYWYSKARDHDNAEKYNLSDCIECGACAWVCPSNIPLVHYYRQEKAEIGLLREEAAQAERAKLRFEAKKQRLEEEKLAREVRATTAPARPVVATTDSGHDPIAAAILRIKAQQNSNSTDKTDIQAEREARKEQARQHQAEKAKHASESTEPTTNSDDARKAAVAAALARAKARKAELVGKTDTTNNAVANSSSINAEQEPVAVDPDAARKAAVAAAIARAKAKKAQAEANAVSNTETQE